MPSPNSDRVAMCGESIPSSLKQRLLFFDRIGVASLETMIEDLRAFNSDQANSYVNDLEFLQSKNVVFEMFPWFKPAGVSFRVNGERCLDDRLAMYIVKYHQHMEKKKKARLRRLTAKEHRMLFGISVYFVARVSAYRMQHSEGLETSVVRSEPLILPHQINQIKRLPKIPGQPELVVPKSVLSTDVVDVVLDKLPMPSEDTPWEAILDFKADAEAQGYLQGLKVWMGEIARQKLTANEAREKLEWLLFQHQKHMKAHKLSYRWGILGGTFVAAAEILGGLPVVKWVKAAGAAVSIVERRQELMKAELANPAKEISYIVKAQEQFER
jgi:hypothetical protein